MFLRRLGHGRKIRHGHHGHGHAYNFIWPQIQSLLAIDLARNGQNQTNLGIVGHLAMPTIPLLLRAWVGTYPKLLFLQVLVLTPNNQQLLNLLSQNCFFDSSGTCPRFPECRALGFVPKSCFSSHWDQSQLQSVHDIRIVPKVLFSSHWDQSQLQFVHDIRIVPKPSFSLHWQCLYSGHIFIFWS